MVRQIFTNGDADVRTETEILKQFDVHADVLKVGHHGSYTSTSERFIKKVEPQFAILSYGSRNVWASASKCSETIKTAWYNDVWNK